MEFLKRVRTVLLILCVGAGAFFLVNEGCAQIMLWEVRKNFAAMESSPEPECPSGAEVEIERSGLLGWIRFCAVDGEKEGPWEKWDDRRLQIRGHYSGGHPVGVWEWFGDDGEVIKQEERLDQLLNGGRPTF